MPKISVVLPSYNRAQYLMHAVNSILKQTIEDLEIIIVDDGSTDESVSIINDIKEARVRSIILPENTGGPAALNAGIQIAESEYFALCNCDDEWLPNKLEKQLRIFDTSNVEAVFTNASWIDELGSERADSTVPYPQLFEADNRSRHEWLKLLLDGNRFCHPSILTRRRIYDATGLYDNRYRQLSDYDMWLRLLQNYNVFVMPEKLTRFRIFDSLANASSMKPDNALRDANETALILENFFRNLGQENFVAAFGSRKRTDEAGFNIILEKIFFLATRPFRHHLTLRHIAHRLLYDFMLAPEAKSAIASYGEDYQLIHVLGGISSPFRNIRPVIEMSPTEWRKMMDWAGYPSTQELSQEFASNYLDEETLLAEQTRGRIAKLQFKLDESRDQLSKRETRVSELKAHVVELEKSIVHSSNEQKSLELALKASIQNATDLEKEIVELKATISKLGNNRSWSLTAPLRSLQSKAQKPK